MDEHSGEPKEDQVMGDGIGKSEMEELVQSWFQRQGEAYQNGRQLFLYSMM